jgi:hypothetical protein
VAVVLWKFSMKSAIATLSSTTVVQDFRLRSSVYFFHQIDSIIRRASATLSACLGLVPQLL